LPEVLYQNASVRQEVLRRKNLEPPRKGGTVPEELEMTVKIRADAARLLQAVALETGDTPGNISGWLIQREKVELKKMAPLYMMAKNGNRGPA